MVGGARRRRFTRYRCRTGGPRRRVPPWIIQQYIFSEERFHGALPIPLYDMLFEMPVGLDPLPIPPNDDILLPDDAPALDEEVRRRGRHPRETAAFPCTEALLRHAFIEQGIWRGAGSGLDWACEYPVDHGIRQGDERAAG